MIFQLQLKRLGRLTVLKIALTVNQNSGWICCILTAAPVLFSFVQGINVCTDKKSCPSYAIGAIKLFCLLRRFFCFLSFHLANKERPFDSWLIYLPLVSFNQDYRGEGGLCSSRKVQGSRQEPLRREVCNHGPRPPEHERHVLLVERGYQRHGNRDSDRNSAQKDTGNQLLPKKSIPSTNDCWRCKLSTRHATIVQRQRQARRWISYSRRRP